MIIGRGRKQDKRNHCVLYGKEKQQLVESQERKKEREEERQSYISKDISKSKSK